jgi:AcrR family transcriptional regulator
MSRVDLNKSKALDAICAHLLREGLAEAGLRTLADAAGTSDRMLVYYFGTKDELMSQALQRLAGELTTMLDAAELSRRPWHDAAHAIWQTLANKAGKPYMLLWVELSGLAARGRQPYAEIAGALVDGFVVWAEAHVDARPGERSRDAARLVAMIEGKALLLSVGRGSLVDTADPPSAPRKRKT